MSGVLAGSQLDVYRLDTLIGEGGMGVVWKAFNTTLERTEALKLILSEHARDENFRKRFGLEAIAAARLDHENILPVYAASNSGEHLYIAMRFVDGVDLSQALEEEGKFEPGRAVSLLTQAARALDAAHEVGLLHRDVKPANLLIEGSERVYLTDFGLAKYERALDDRTRQFVGTVAYAAPEQLEIRTLGPETDVYALGIVLFQCLTGRLPYKPSSTAALVKAHLVDTPLSAHALNKQLPVELDEVIAKALAKKMRHRYETCSEMLSEATSALGVEEAPEVSEKPAGSSKALAAAAGGLLVFLAGKAWEKMKETEGTGVGPRPHAPLPQPSQPYAPQPANVAAVLPGLWTVAIVAPNGLTSTGSVQANASRQFRASYVGPGGSFEEYGTWEVTGPTQVTFRGERTPLGQPGLKTPYVFGVGFQSVSRNLMEGVTSGSERVTWTRVE